MLRGQNGITLVALVVTIIILIILATISISIVFNGGLIDKAQKGGNLHEQAAYNENQQIQQADDVANAYLTNAGFYNNQ